MQRLPPGQRSRVEVVGDDGGRSLQTLRADGARSARTGQRAFALPQARRPAAGERLGEAIKRTQARHEQAAPSSRVYAVADAIRALARVAAAVCNMALVAGDMDMLDLVPALEPLFRSRPRCAFSRRSSRARGRSSAIHLRSHRFWPRSRTPCVGAAVDLDALAAAGESRGARDPERAFDLQRGVVSLVADGARREGDLVGDAARSRASATDPRSSPRRRRLGHRVDNRPRRAGWPPTAHAWPRPASASPR